MKARRAGLGVAAVAAGFALIAGCLAGRRDVPLETLIAFSDPGECVPGPALARLIDSFFQRVQRGDDVMFAAPSPVVPPALRAQIGRPVVTFPKDGLGETEVELPVRGLWRGLRVTRISAYAVPEGDANGFSIHFAASRAAVRKAANAAGLAIPATGERETGDGLTTIIGLGADTGGGTWLSCSQG